MISFFFSFEIAMIDSFSLRFIRVLGLAHLIPRKSYLSLTTFLFYQEGKFLSTDTNYKSSTPNRLRLFISSCVKRRKVPVANSLSKVNGPIARRSKSATFLPQAATIRFT